MKPNETITAKKEQWKQLHGKQKIQYIWDYYKFPMIVCFIFLYIIGYTAYRHFNKKDLVLYAGLINISSSEQLNLQLSNDFLEFMDETISQKKVQLYTGLYLTSDPNNPHHEYTYASRIKILAAIDSEQLDVVFMDRESFDAFSQNGYLCNLEHLLQDLSPDTFDTLKPYLVTNTSILEDNSEDLLADSSLPYQAVTEEYPMGLNVSQTGILKQAGFNDDIYLGVVGNSPRTRNAVKYINYLYTGNEP